MSEPIQLEEIKRLQLDILIAVDSFCKKHNLRYVLSFGTLIGAVRHQGFIPWDDDIDICMPHKDYLRMINLVNDKHNGGMLTDRYRLADVRVCSDIPYHQTFGKVYDTKTVARKTSLKSSLGFQEGVFIDIFSISGIPEDENEARHRIEKLRYANAMAYYASRCPCLDDFRIRHPRQALHNLVGYIKSSRRSVEEWTQLYAEYLDVFPDSDNAKAAYSIKAMLIVGERIALNSNPWFPSVLADFEGYKFPIPERYDEILSACYGDYMKLPPVEAQKPSHDQNFCFI